MPAPANSTRLTATEISSLPASLTQDVNDSGTTYTVWYKWTALADAILKVWAFGGYTSYRPALFMYENADVADYMNLGQLWSTRQAPVYVPVTAGNTYYFEIFHSASIFASVAVLQLSVESVDDLGVSLGDFLNNLEVDGDAEGPMSVLSGSLSKTAKRYQQVAAPTDVRGQDGLPHGQQGVSFLNGNFGWRDEQYPNIKLYDTTLAHLITIALPSDGVALGLSRVLDRMYAVYGSSGSRSVRSYSNVGAVVATLNTTITTITHLGVNAAGTILYYNPGGTTTIKRWDLSGNVAMADLVADTAGYRIEDLIVLEDDTILVVWHEETSTPRDVKVQHYDTAGAVLHTYEFGDLWRSGANPPRIGFALDSPTHFWITLKPEGQNGLSYFRKIKISDGTTTTSLEHVNYLAEVQLGLSSATYPKTTGTINTFSATYPSRTGAPPSTVTYTLITAAAFDRTMQMTITAAEDFLATQPTFQVGRTGNVEAYFPAATFVNAVAGTQWVLETTIPAGTDVIITEAESVNPNTGALSFSVPVVSPVSQAAIITSGAGQDIKVVVSVRDTFADGTGMQPRFEIGRTGDTDAIAPASTFVDQPEGASFAFDVTLAAGEDVVVTATRAIGAGTGDISVDVYETPANAGLLGAEKSGALLVANFDIDAPAAIIVRKVSVPETDATEFAFTAGGGLFPSGFTLSGGQERAFTNVTPGAGYSFTEVVPPGYTSEVTVSNGSPVTNISVGVSEVVIVTFTNYAVNPQPPTEVRYLRRLRRAPHLNHEHLRITYDRVELLAQVGFGRPEGQGEIPIVYLRWSNDGGYTWGNQQAVSMGALGRYQLQAVWTRTGQAEERLFEWSTSEPVDLVWLDVFLKLRQGRS